MRTVLLTLMLSVAPIVALAQSSNPLALSSEASRGSVQAVGNGVAAVGTLVAIPPMAVADLGSAVAESAKPGPLPLGAKSVTAGPSPDQAMRK